MPVLRNLLKLAGSRKLSQRKLLSVHHRPPSFPLHPWYVHSSTPLMATLYTSKPSSTTSHCRGGKPDWPKKAFKIGSGDTAINCDVTQRLLKGKDIGFRLKWELNKLPGKDAVQSGMVCS